jgi:protein involved in polysaccharide export with SLBB domain
MKKILLAISILLFTIITNAQTLDKSLYNSNLINATAISVTIGGDFPVTGSFPASLSERVDQFVTRLYLEARGRSVGTSNDPKIIREIEAELRNYSLRGIILKRSNGEELSVDLQRFRITGDFKYNPYLQNDDVLIFPPNNMTRNFFTVYGAVNKPNIFFYVEGDSLSDALELARGLDESFENSGKVAISRLDYAGKTLLTDTVDINSKIRINRGDQIKLLAPENQRKNFYVLVLGEVKNPGSVPITKNNTKLHEVIKFVGGFTDRSSLKRARLYTGNSLAVYLEKLYGINLAEQPDLEDEDFRNTIIDLETLQMSRMSNIYQEDLPNFITENQLRVLTEGSSLDFAKINDPNSDIGQYVVKSGDVIVVPPIRKAVYVFGQIANPGYIPLTEGMDYNYYIDEAGGMGQFAVEDEIMVIKGGSRFWISPLEQSVTLEEGDYIYVPKEELRPFRAYAAEYAIYIGMLASIATVILLVITAFK